MFALGQKLANSHKVLFLQWELGAGKTTLIKWWAAGLGMDPSKVNSPTYTYIQEYSVQSRKYKVQSTKYKKTQGLDDEDSGFRQNDSIKKMLHIDMYNIHSFDQLVEKGIAELVHDYQYIAIEWPKFIEELGLDGTMISIEKKDGDERVVNYELWIIG